MIGKQGGARATTIGAIMGGLASGAEGSISEGVATMGKIKKHNYNSFNGVYYLTIQLFYLIRTLQDREVPSIWYSILSMAILYVAVYFAVKKIRH